MSAPFYDTDLTDPAWAWVDIISNQLRRISVYVAVQPHRKHVKSLAQRRCRNALISHATRWNLQPFAERLPIDSTDVINALVVTTNHDEQPVRERGGGDRFLRLRKSWKRRPAPKWMPILRGICVH